MASLFAVASEESGLTEEELGDRLSGEEHRLFLAAEIVEASMKTTVPEKITAFGRLLANAATDGSTVEADRVLVSILASLEEAHLRLLALLESTPPKAKIQNREMTLQGWRLQQIIEADPGLTGALDMLLPALQAAGLVRDAGTVVSQHGAPMNDYQWTATESGRRVLERLRSLSTHDG